jgi:hypothetical protein
MLTGGMVGGSYKFSDLLKKNKSKTKKRSKKLKGDPSQLGYKANKSNLNIIMKGSDGNLYKNKLYKKTKRWVKINKKNKKKK